MVNYLIKTKLDLVLVFSSQNIWKISCLCKPYLRGWWIKINGSYTDTIKYLLSSVVFLSKILLRLGIHGFQFSIKLRNL